ncbi:MAG: exodeoxyribonuclease VII small subunit [Elusimicrobia bacterium]|nr:exodeoxyribonuclease VII small subunit [Elusimicrobiota bacterium]
MKNVKAAPKETFESSLQGLEDIVRRLEAGDQGLEASLALFEQGVAAAKELSQRLEEAKRRVEVLCKENDKLARKPLEENAK